MSTPIRRPEMCTKVYHWSSLQCIMIVLERHCSMLNAQYVITEDIQC